MPLTTRSVGRALAAAVLVGALGTGAGAAAASGSADHSGAAVPASAVITPGAGPVSVAVVVPVTAPATTTGLLSADDLTRYTGPFGTLTRQLDAVAGTRATIALDPLIPASIRVLGAAAPASATQWLARLQATSNEVFLLAYGDADVVAGVRTGTVGDLVPSGFGFALDPANFSPAVTAAPTPAPTETPAPDPGAPPPFPTTEDVLAWTTALPRIAWPSADVGAGDIAGLAAVGYDDVIVPSTVAGEPSAPLVALDGVDAIVADSALSARLAEVVAATAPATRTAALDALDADLAARTAAAPGRGLVLTVDRAWNSTSSGLADALARLQATASANAVELSDILTTPAIAGQLGEGVAAPERDAIFTELAADAAAETAFSSVLADPGVLLDPRRLERVALYSLAWEQDAEGWTAAVEAFRERSTEILGSVKLEQGSDVALLARNADLKVSVSNALPYAVTVTVTVNPRSPILRANGSKELTIEPESTGTARLPVEAIANGEVRVLTSITSPTGVPLDSGHASVTVRAEWEGIGTLVVVIVLAIVFAAGVVRIVLKRRRSRRADADPDDADRTEGADG